MKTRTVRSSTSESSTDIGRRSFLVVSTAAAGSLVLGLTPFAATSAPTAATLQTMNAFVAIHSTGRVLLTMAKVEMGQGTYTALPMLLAEELEVDLDSVDLAHAPPNAKVYGIPIGDQFTGGSTSIQFMWEPMRRAGATARTMLIQTAAARWKVSPESCHAQSGVVIHEPSGRRIGYGQLVTGASKLPVPVDVKLKSPDQFRLVGKPLKRLDTPAKVNGSAVFGIDVVVPGMKVATVAASPVIGGTLLSVEEGGVRSMPGVRGVIRIADAVAVVADNLWQAKQGLAALRITWSPGPNAELDTQALRNLMVGSLSRTGVPARNDGDALATLASAPRRIDATYVNPLLAHAAMEPLSCVVHVQTGKAEIWTGTQVPARARDAAAKLLDLPPESVTLNNHLLGGAFGRRLEHDYVDQAVLFAKQWNGPLKIVWTREEDIQHDVPRGMYAHRVSACLDAKGNPLALLHKIAGPSNYATFIPASTKDGIDADSVEGSVQFRYDIPHMRTEWIREDGPIPTTFWRGVGPTRNLVVLESFIDELASIAGRDPVEYRLGLLGKDERAHHVVSRAAAIAGWNSPLPARSGRGVALLYAWKTYLAQVVELAVGEDGQVLVKRVVCVVDCGSVVNPDTVVAQMQGGIIYALSAALHGEITLRNGRVEQSNFHDYQVVRMNETPVIDVELVQSREAPGGVGEPGTAGFFGAFVNAVFAATGKRIYSLPAPASALRAAA